MSRARYYKLLEQGRVPKADLNCGNNPKGGLYFDEVSAMDIYSVFALNQGLFSKDYMFKLSQDLHEKAVQTRFKKETR